MDEKHFRIDPPLKSGSLYFNYKDTYSVVLLAVVDAQLRFIYTDVDTNGRISDSGTWNKCSLKTCLENKSINVPLSTPLPGTDNTFPYIIVGDEGFPLSESVHIPYPEDQCRGRKDRRIFNYRLSRARRCSENAFRVLGARFQIFRSAMCCDPDDASKLILACCCLHNMLRTQVVGRTMYSPPAFLDVEDELMGQFHRGEWHDAPAVGMVDFANQGGNRNGNSALQFRDECCNYFNNVGVVPWQDRMVQ